MATYAFSDVFLGVGSIHGFGETPCTRRSIFIHVRKAFDDLDASREHWNLQ